MASTERVTVTLARELVDAIDRLERNRSRFVAEAVTRELARRRRELLLKSLETPHAETTDLVDVGLAEWSAGLPAGDDALVDGRDGVAVQWVEGTGWVEQST